MGDDSSKNPEKMGMGVPVAIVLAGAIIAAALYFRPVDPAGGLAGDDLVGRGTGQEAGQVAGTKVDVAIEDYSAVLGSPDAPVTIIEFTDFDCPFCKRHHDETWPQLKAQYIDTGKVKYVTRHFPLPQLHPQATAAAMAAQCAQRQGEFYDYTQKLFANQQSFTDENLKKYAEEIGLEMEDFEQCLDNKETENEVSADQQAGVAAGVTGTPGFFINGRILEGAQPLAQFQALIEAEL